MSYLNKIECVNPEHKLKQADIAKVASLWMKDNEELQKKYVRISRNSGVGNRNFILPYQDLIKPMGLNEKSKHFEFHGKNLLKSSISKLLKSADLSPKDVGGLIFTSCSMPSIPAIDAEVLLDLEFDNTIARIPIFQHGCAGGVIALKIADNLKSLKKPIIVCSVEVCSLVFNPSHATGTELVGAAIFADGSASAVVEPNGRGDNLKIVDTYSFLLPNTKHLMGYNINDDSLSLKLDKGLPGALTEAAPSIITSFLDKHNLKINDIKHWLFHPGGIKILNFLKETLNLEHENCRYSYDVLYKYGNMSSATIFFVLNEFINAQVAKEGDNVLVVGIGPGLTIEIVLLKKT